MYNTYDTTYSEDRRSLYLAVGIASLSLISFSETNTVIVDYPTPKECVQIEQKTVEESSSELTKHAMNLAQESLLEDWNEEDDDHWASFL